MSVSDWVLLVAVPAVLIGVGLGVYRRGRAALHGATRMSSGSAATPGPADARPDAGSGSTRGVGREQRLRALVAAQRQRLRGVILVGLGAIWLVVGIISRLT